MRNKMKNTNQIKRTKMKNKNRKTEKRRKKKLLMKLDDAKEKTKQFRKNKNV